jgi:hypothetical protein
MKKRNWIDKPLLKTMTYIRQYICYICRKRILAKRKYYDGGHSYRAHEECVKEAK